MNKHRLSITPYIITFIVILFCDRLTKWLAFNYVPTSGYTVNELLSFFVSYNRGISWSIFASDETLIFVIVSSIIGLFVAGFFIYALLQWLNNYSIIGETFVLAGACSNLIDRFLYCGVLDFIFLSWHEWHWPIFNVADLSIVVGIGIMMVATVFNR